MSGVWDTIVNAATGTLTESQKAELVAQEAADLIKAGADPAAAQAQAEHDVTATLMADNADPSQQSVANALVGPYNAALTGNPLTSPAPGTSLLLIGILVGGVYLIGKAIE